MEAVRGRGGGGERSGWRREVRVEEVRSGWRR